MEPLPGTAPYRPLSLRLCLGLIDAAALLVPSGKRPEWRAQWRAELLHRWGRRVERLENQDSTPQSFLLWSGGAFQHAWYLLRTEYTMDLIWQDVKFGIRALRRSKGLIAIAVLSLAIGIGANTSIFSAVDVFMFRPLPYPDSQDLNVVWVTNQERGWQQVTFSVPDFLDLRDQSATMDVAATRGGSFNLSGDFEAELLRGTYVTDGFFQVLGVQPALGRAFTTEESVPGSDRVAVISDGLWRRRFGADPEIIGRSIVLDGFPSTVVGVMPPHFWYRFPGVDIWAPAAFTGQDPRDSHFLLVLGRVREGFSRDQALGEAQSIMARIAQAYPETSAGHSAFIQTLHENIFDEGFQSGTAIASVGVALLLLIACANAANLLLTHAAGRDREVALRGALGAGRARIVRQFLTEATIVAVLGGILGTLLAILGIPALTSIMPPQFPRVHEIGLSPRVLLYTAGITMLTGILFGLAPALQSSKSNMADALSEGGRGGTGSRGARLRKVLVAGEVAMALVLLVSSALLVKGFARIRLADLGFDRTDVLTFQTLLPTGQYTDTASVQDFTTRLVDRLQALPGVETVGAAMNLPLNGYSSTYYALAGEDYEDINQRKITGFNYVLPGYFDALDIPVLRGRGIEEGDKLGALPVAVINQALAERHWPDGDPVGQQIVLYSGPREIVGVVANSKDAGADAGDLATLFMPMYQSVQRAPDWAVEATVPLESLTEPVRSAVRALDPSIPAYEVMPMDDLIELSLGGDLIMAKIMSAIALIALVLALGGVYGVMAYSVSQRTRELGIRMSLGAQRANVMSMVVRQGTVLALIGILVGIGIGLMVTRGLSRFLFGVSPFDPGTFVAVSAMLLVAGVAATFFPARRATKVDPVTALKTE